jgi:hypothetical protein
MPKLSPPTKQLARTVRCRTMVAAVACLALATATAAVAAIAAAATAAAAARDLPTFRAGLWQFDRTLESDGDVNDRRITSGTSIQPREQRCVDPTAAMKSLSVTFPFASCRSSNVQNNDSELVVTKKCGPGDDVKTVIKVESDSAYTQVTEGMIGAKHSREAIVARRIGDCRIGQR